MALSDKLHSPLQSCCIGSGESHVFTAANSSSVASQAVKTAGAEADGASWLWRGVGAMSLPRGTMPPQAMANHTMQHTKSKEVLEYNSCRQGSASRPGNATDCGILLYSSATSAPTSATSALISTCTLRGASTRKHASGLLVLYSSPSKACLASSFSSWCSRPRMSSQRWPRRCRAVQGWVGAVGSAAVGRLVGTWQPGSGG